MKDEPIDPRIDTMIASLYGELSEDEERAFQKLLAEDADLRAEWEEMKGTRAALRGWEVDEPAPSFVLVDRADRPDRARRARSRAAERAGRLAALFARPAALPAIAALAAAAIIAILAINRFRVERTDRGFAFEFGAGAPAIVAANGARDAHDAAPVQPAAASGSAAQYLARETAPSWRDAGGPGDATDAAIVPVSDQAPYMTRKEFETYSDGMAKTIVAILNEYGQKNEREMSRVLWSLYKDLDQKQTAAYGDLRGRIDAVGVGLLVEQSKADAKLEDLIDKNKGEPLTPLTNTPSRKPEEK